MRFVVTGGAGFIGSHIVKNLLKSGHEVSVIDNMHTGRKENISSILDNINFYEYDIRDYEKIESVLSSCDGIFHEAALTVVQESFIKQKDYHEVNVVGTRNIFEISKKYDLKVIFASSSSIYGNALKIPINEDAPRMPINPYGQTKLDDEKLAQQFNIDGGKIIGLRYFNVFGKGQTGSYAGVITKFMNNLNEKLDLVINGDGTQVRDFVHVEDVAKANLLAMESSISKGFFNIGTGVKTSITELAKMMIDIWNSSSGIKFAKALEGDVKISQADIKLTQKTLGWKYNMSLREGLKNLKKQG
ncbi:MAG: SDR family NAD(P)-dependent oxidoreductase [Crenarchaeota archaeon]|nr:MAG: SDR family NAD(P)-dependent oxidoreductase [Thermoproteota archaeon]RDJ33359.1 MAG: SDR family NAD(P)-dependent oxidoreductase [Thermoproteota archaeon]RDJ36137.1 MAG: SDR family NAD(P)-dependent oxidoreductase [Thermoproteota archaeon]RDJ38769.1 MAG: SDR family NAD(P)-dependent oxidoreductase [Thermoproteota archaeon]